MKRLFICSILLGMTALTVLAQSGTSSPYSQFGLGIMSDQSQGFSRGMNGLGIGLRGGTMVNSLNPASYSAIDSLTMIFDMGLSRPVCASIWVPTLSLLLPTYSTSCLSTSHGASSPFSAKTKSVVVLLPLVLRLQVPSV